MAEPYILPMRNPVQYYDWGSFEVIAALQGRPVPSDRPEAELWMGAHPSAPSLVPWQGSWQPLPRVIEKDPVAILGRSAAGRFGPRLPFLFKVLAARLPLSIQAHPSLLQAREGFRRENLLGIPLDAPHRNYRDDNHKPEIICALTTFWALKGFRPRRESMEMLGALKGRPESISLEPLWAQPGPEGLRVFFTSILNLEYPARAAAVAAITRAFLETAGERPEAEWVRKLEKAYPGDPGLLCPILLNLVRLEPGEALFLGPGELHAYLEGTGVELMANSDNVLRGGLTSKHTDPAELLQVLTFEEGPATAIRGRGITPFEYSFDAPAREFRLSRIVLEEAGPEVKMDGDGVEVLLCTSGRLTAKTGFPGPGNSRTFVQGESILHPAAAGPYRLGGCGTVYRASLPD